MGIAFIIIALLVFSNLVQLGVALHDRRQIIAHSSELAVLNARKTIVLADASKELQRLAYKQNAAEQVSLNLFVQFVPGFTESELLSSFHGDVSMRLMELSRELNNAAMDGTDSDCPICSVEPMPEILSESLGGDPKRHRTR